MLFRRCYRLNKPLLAGVPDQFTCTTEYSVPSADTTVYSVPSVDNWRCRSVYILVFHCHKLKLKHPPCTTGRCQLIICPFFKYAWYTWYATRTRENPAAQTKLWFPAVNFCRNFVRKFFSLLPILTSAACLRWLNRTEHQPTERRVKLGMGQGAIQIQGAILQSRYI